MIVKFKKNMESILCKWAGNLEMEKGGGKGGGRDDERIYISYVQVPTAHKECSHYVLQICNN